MQVRITEIIDEAKNIRSFRLQPEKKIDYLPGQWMYVTLNPKPQIANLKHHFTISSSSTENFLQFTTKFREESDYKKALWQKRIGDVIDINGPFGSFVLDPKDTTPKLFIAGGIGITPFRSIIKHVTDKKLTTSIQLLYSVTTASEAAFLNLPFSTIIETKNQGRLDAQKIKQHCPDWQERSWWICGSPAMVEAVVTLAQDMKMSTDKIRSEEFTGY